DRQADRDQHDPAVGGGAGVQQGRRAVGSAAAGTGDQEHPRGDVGVLAVCVKETKMEAVLEAQARDTFGKNEARRTRRDGQVPGVLYGGDGKAAMPISVAPKALLKILHSESGQNTLISLKLAGAGDNRVLIKDFQLDPITHDLLHVDLLKIAMDKVLQVT